MHSGMEPCGHDLLGGDLRSHRRHGVVEERRPLDAMPGRAAEGAGGLEAAPSLFIAESRQRPDRAVHGRSVLRVGDALVGAEHQAATALVADARDAMWRRTPHALGPELEELTDDHEQRALRRRCGDPILAAAGLELQAGGVGQMKGGRPKILVSCHRGMGGVVAHRSQQSLRMRHQHLADEFSRLTDIFRQCAMQHVRHTLRLVKIRLERLAQRFSSSGVRPDVTPGLPNRGIEIPRWRIHRVFVNTLWGCLRPIGTDSAVVLGIGRHEAWGHHSRRLRQQLRPTLNVCTAAFLQCHLGRQQCPLHDIVRDAMADHCEDAM
mmetsp:Transcript_110362/g.351823  ORF Transcript_110362/g.351823 Transcript_110362/m.351823 type:complete len:322 (-) Transcript_110362:282-1247(-)